MTEDNLQEIQRIEQKLQSILYQKQAFQMELAETNSALKEIENSGDEVFKIVGQLMIKADKTKIKDELENKKKILELQEKTLDKQEASLTEQMEKARNKVISSEKK